LVESEEAFVVITQYLMHICESRAFGTDRVIYLYRVPPGQADVSLTSKGSDNETKL
jgi:hypothetical protein